MRRLLVLAAMLVTTSAHAERAARRNMPTLVRGGPGQLSMQLAFDGKPTAAVCTTPSQCDGAPPRPLPLREPFASQGVMSGLTTAVALDNGRQVMVLTFGDGSQGRLVAIVAAPLATSSEREALVLWQGVASLNEDTRAPNAVETRALGQGRFQIVVGERRDDIGLCGNRPTLISPRVLDPADMTMKAAKIPRLSDDVRASAKRLVAERRSSDRPRPLAQLLTATGATSAVGAPGAAVDGDLETTWSEGRSGDGRGELLTMRVPKDVAITSLSLAPRPKTREIDGGAAPKKIFVTTDDEVFELLLPEDGWQHPGAFYDVKLPAPVSTSCLAVVLDESYAPSTTKAPVVSIAELEARTSFDEGGDPKSLVAALAGGDRRAKAAAAVLMRGGPAAQRAVAEGYASLDDQGRLLALDVVDQQGCEAASPLYVRALGGTFEPEVIHARTRIERCRRAAVPALIAAVSDPAHPARFPSIDELSLIAPGDAVIALAPLVVADDAALRRKAREGFTRAVGTPRASEALARALSSTTLPPLARLHVLRLASARLADDPVRAEASSALAKAATDPASKYLLLPAAATLARAGDEAALSLLRGTLTDPLPWLRAAGARAAATVPALVPAVSALAADAEPRVREAVATGADAAHLGALAADEWTFVRTAAYVSVGTAPPDPALDAMLAARLGVEVAPAALVRAIDAAAARDLKAAAPRLRELALDLKRSLDVRARAIAALGRTCDRDAVELLGDVAKKGASASSAGDDQILASAAIAALGRLHPADLATRLASLSGQGASLMVKNASRAAAADDDVCRLGVAPK
jgi:hypothetical protein